uniref:Glutaredoxin domain-containing protein n=1 Tax=Entomoneis paludosa TaxID=265537 RepID=A0A7S2Y8C0_9STRA|mmetsp:Transcript_22226/g.46351  ORF Transcript_22226/g.46351 Transcript_22226/m.46351 type:complete len:106 (+) Transcript_22226:420-737(+)
MAESAFLFLLSSQYCQRTRHLLQELHKEFEGWTLKIIDIDTFDDPQDGPLIQSLLLDLTKQRTVPNIFIGGEHLGGNDDLQSMFHAGDLIPALEELAGLSQSDEV